MKESNLQRTVDNYKRVLDTLQSFCGEARLAQEPSYDFSEREMNKLYCYIIGETKSNDKVFREALQLLKIKKLKYIKLDSSCLAEEILSHYKHSIVTKICRLASENRSEEIFKKEYYRDNLLAFYVIMDRFLRLSKDKMPDGFFAFITEMDGDFRYLLWDFVKKHGSIPDDRMDSLPRTCTSTTRHDVGVLAGINSLLYFGVSSNDSVNIAIFALRGYLECWVRESFDIPDAGGESKTISTIIQAICESISVEPDKELKKYFESIGAINRWSNIYIHSKRKVVFWVPHFIALYLDGLREHVVKKIVEERQEYTLFPALTQKDSALYNSVREKLKISS